MRAAVYRGPNRVELEELPIPEIGPGEILVRVRACGVCGTDLKKIAYGWQNHPAFSVTNRRARWWPSHLRKRNGAWGTG